MDAPGGAREPRFGSPYGMGLLSEVPDMYGAGRPPSSLGGGSGALRQGMQPCPVPRGVKRPSDQCYEERPSQSMGLEHCPMPDIADDGYASLQPKKSPPSNGKKTKGRVKIKMEYIDNKLRRYTTFSKRKTGIMKKAYELSTLTGTQVMLLVASETGHVYTFATRKLQPMITSDAGKRLIQTCLNSPDPPTTSEQRMAATGFEETELTYNVVDEDMKEESEEEDDDDFEKNDDANEADNIREADNLKEANNLKEEEHLKEADSLEEADNVKEQCNVKQSIRPAKKKRVKEGSDAEDGKRVKKGHKRITKKGKLKDEPASSGDSGDESGSEPESPGEKMNLQPPSHRPQDWAIRDSPHDDRDPQASTSSTPQEADSSKSSQPCLPKLMPKIEMPGGAMLYHPGMLAGVGLDGLGSNLGLGNLAMGYPHSFILGLANQGQEGTASSSSSQPQFITIPLSMAMAAAAGNPTTSSAGNGCHVSASSDDSSELQDLSTSGRK